MEKTKTNQEVKLNVSLIQNIDLEIGSNHVMRNSKNTKSILELSNQNEVYYLDACNILYVEADGNYCNVHLTDGDVLETVSFQRAEVARMIHTQLDRRIASEFALVGRPYLINTEHLLHINVPKQQLTFDINQQGTCMKQKIRVSSEALRKLRLLIEEATEEEAPANVAYRRSRNSVHNNRGFTSFLSNANGNQMPMSMPEEKDFDISDDEVMMLG